MQIVNMSVHQKKSSSYFPTHTNKADKQSLLSKPHILLVEDQPMIQIIERTLLESLNCHVDIAQNGKEALDKISFNYNLIIVDIGLPDMNGVALCRKLRHYISQIVPIVVLTAQGDSFLPSALAAGATEYLIKPVSAKQLYHVINSYLGDRFNILKPK